MALKYWQTSCLVFCLALVLCTQATWAVDGRLQVIDFTAKSCGPCQSMQPAIVRLAKEGWQIRQVDVEQERQLLEPFQIKSVPTLVVLREGKEVDRIVGALGYDKLKIRLEKAAGTNHNQLRDDFMAMIQANNAPAPHGDRAAPASPTARGQSPTPFPMLSAATLGAFAVDASTSRESAVATPGSPDQMVDISLANRGPADASQAIDASRANNPQVMAATPGRSGSTSTDPFQQPFASTPANSLAISSSTNQPVGQFASASSPAASGLTPQMAIARAQAATVRIRIDEPNSLSFGTGTVVHINGDQALVLTCGHLFRDITPGARLSVDLFHEGQTINVPAQVVSFNAKDADIGLMEFRSPIKLTPVQVADKSAAPQIGQPAFSFGCDKGADPSRRDTQIKRLNRYLGAANVEIHGAPVVGRSGGGLFDIQGRLIGVCNAADEEDNEGIYAALPVIHQQLAALKLEAIAQNNVASAPSLPTSSTSSTPPGYWPDERADSPLARSAAAPGTQVQCVIRDAQGRQTTLTIDRASEELLAMLRQSATVR